MEIGDGRLITSPEIIKNGGAANQEYVEYIYRVERTRVLAAGGTLATEVEHSPLEGNNRSFEIDRLINEHFWTCTPDGIGTDGQPDGREKPYGHDNIHIVLPDAGNADTHKRYNVSQGLLIVVQRAMAAGVMIELYRQMSKISLFCVVNNSLPKIKQYLYENIDRFHTVEESVALAERYVVGHSGGGAISKFSNSAFAQHLNHHNFNNTEQTLSLEMADQTQEDLNYQYGDNQYDWQINAIGRNFRRGGRRNTRPWGRGGGFGGGNISRLPFSVNPESSNRLARNNESNDYAAQKVQGLCFRCGSSAHVVKQCP